VLERVAPLDGASHPKWSDANLYAARKLLENAEVYRGNVRLKVASDRQRELAFIFAKEGRRIRNEYLARSL
jgi:hypothetical protein